MWNLGLEMIGQPVVSYRLEQMVRRGYAPHIVKLGEEDGFVRFHILLVHPEPGFRPAVLMANGHVGVLTGEGVPVADISWDETLRFALFLWQGRARNIGAWAWRIVRRLPSVLGLTLFGILMLLVAPRVVLVLAEILEAASLLDWISASKSGNQLFLALVFGGIASLAGLLVGVRILAALTRRQDPRHANPPDAGSASGPTAP